MGIFLKHFNYPKMCIKQNVNEGGVEDEILAFVEFSLFFGTLYENQQRYGNTQYRIFFVIACP